MNARTLRLLVPVAALTLGVALLGATIYVTYFGSGGPQQQPVAAIGGHFELISQDGKTVTEKDFLGRPMLVFFGYTHCPDICPTTLFDVSEAFRKLGPDKKIAGVFVTVDPERDTPAVMKDYLSSFDPRITGLSGDQAAVAVAAKAYRAFYRKSPGESGEYSMDHSAIVYLMDKQGRFVSSFNLQQSPDDAAKQLAKYL